MVHQDLSLVVEKAFGRSEAFTKRAIPIGQLYELFFAGRLQHTISSWTEITKSDLQEGHFGALLGLMSDDTFVAWLPAWLIHVGSHGLEVPRALISFAGAFSPEVSAETGKLDRLRDRVSWLNPDQRRAVALAGRKIAGDAEIIRYCGLDVGESVGRAWERYADVGFQA